MKATAIKLLIAMTAILVALSGFACAYQSEAESVGSDPAANNQQKQLQTTETQDIISDDPMLRQALEARPDDTVSRLNHTPGIANSYTLALEHSDNGDTSAMPRIFTDQEAMLTGIWQRSINGIVVITTKSEGYSFFPSGGSGTGWFWDRDGHIITSLHVIRSVYGDMADSINIRTFSGEEYVAEFVGGDATSDIAVLRVDADPSAYNALPTGGTANLIPGMTAIAIGHPFGEQQAFSMTTGIVSGLSRSMQSSYQTRQIFGVIQTDADMNPGNSGGPLLNSSGEVIGVNTQIRSNDRANSGVGFAVPIELVQRVANNIIMHGKHEYSFMGVSTRVLIPERADELGFPENTAGIYITRVSSQSPAAKAGLKGDTGVYELDGNGDLILSIDGVKMVDGDEFLEYITMNTVPGETVTLGVMRNGEVIKIDLTMGSLP